MNRNAIALSSICVAGLLAGCSGRQAVTVNSKNQYEFPVKAGVSSVMVLNDYRLDDHLYRPTPVESTTVTIQTKGGGDIFYVATSTSMTRGEHNAKAIMATIGIALADSYPLLFAGNAGKVAAIQRKQKTKNDAHARQLESEIAAVKKLIADIKEAEDKRLKDETAAAKACLTQFLPSWAVGFDARPK
ncbi:MAG: hypothetical protein H0U72_07015 [Nitrosospira sp.]|nr:hypothetical protein [Nitrosospira sp.]